MDAGLLTTQQAGEAGDLERVRDGALGAGGHEVDGLGRGALDPSGEIGAVLGGSPVGHAA